MKNWLGYGWIALVVVACTLNDPKPSSEVCLVTDIVQYQNQDSSQREISRQRFNYDNGKLTHYSVQTPDRSVAFQFKYIGGKIATAFTPDRTTQLSFEYDFLERIEKAILSVNGIEQTVFSVQYAPYERPVRVAKIVETRVVQPVNSPVISRIFQFTYQSIAINTDDLVSQAIQNSYKDGSRTEEEFTFEQDAAYHSPFYDSGQTAVLVLLNLSMNPTGEAARFLQRFDCKSIKHQITTTSGSIARSESSQFTNQFDQTFKPIRSEQRSHLSIPSDSFPADRQYQQTFQYTCE